MFYTSHGLYFCGMYPANTNVDYLRHEFNESIFKQLFVCAKWHFIARAYSWAYSFWRSQLKPVILWYSKNFYRAYLYTRQVLRHRKTNEFAQTYVVGIAGVDTNRHWEIGGCGSIYTLSNRFLPFLPFCYMSEVAVWTVPE